jgi:VanZ family protein
MPEKPVRIVAFAPALGWGILILYFSLLPGDELPGFLIHARDVVLHFLIYMIFGFFLIFGANGYTKKKVATQFLFLSVVISFVLGLVIEVIQGYFIAGRNFEWADILFNTLGSFLVFPLNAFLKR